MADQASAIAVASEEALKVQKRQKQCESKVEACLDQLLEAVQMSRAVAAAGGGPAVMSQLKQRSDELLKDANSHTKELHASITKLSKALAPTNLLDEKAGDYSSVCKLLGGGGVTRETAILNKVVAEHLYREGRFEAGDALAREAGLDPSEAASLKGPYQAMHVVLKHVRARDLGPALQWARANAAGLSALGSRGACTPQAGAAGAAAPACAATAAGSAGGGVAPSAFEFRLHSLAFLSALLQQGQAAALEYARAHFGPFRHSQLKEIQRLMGCLVYCRPAGQYSSNTPTAARGGAAGQQAAVQQGQCSEQGGGEPMDVSCSGMGSFPPSASGLSAMAVDGPEGAGPMPFSPSPSPGPGPGYGGCSLPNQSSPRLAPPVLTLAGTPYADLVSEGAWEEVAQEFVRQASSLIGQAYQSPLEVAVAAGAAALPGLAKLAAVMERSGQDMSAVAQLPVELGLGTEFVFHPIFACPVSRDQSTPDNPPMLLPCNHVLCEQSVQKLAKSRTRIFKCPYCPMEARVDNLRPLTFPTPDA